MDGPVRTYKILPGKHAVIDVAEDERFHLTGASFTDAAVLSVEGAGAALRLTIGGGGRHGRVGGVGAPPATVALLSAACPTQRLDLTVSLLPKNKKAGQHALVVHLVGNVIVPQAVAASSGSSKTAVGTKKAPAAAAPRSLPSAAFTKPCHYWAHKGRCPRGEASTFRHEGVVQQQQPPRAAGPEEKEGGQKASPAAPRDGNRSEPAATAPAAGGGSKPAASAVAAGGQNEHKPPHGMATSSRRRRRGRPAASAPPAAAASGSSSSEMNEQEEGEEEDGASVDSLLLESDEEDAFEEARASAHLKGPEAAGEADE
jgi:hypothetical protein